ncbi:MAG: MBG domain-containing protein [Bacteroidota bacterium]
MTIEGIGSYEVTASQAGDNDFNPAPSVTQTFSAAKATINITADDQMISEEDNIPTLTFSYAGFKLSDEAGDIDMAPSISTTATAQSAAGTYPINLMGGMDDLYDLSLIDGVLTIEPILNVEDNNVTIYPNPTENSIMIEGLEYDSYQVISMDGKVKQANQRKEVLDPSELEAGQYVLKLMKGVELIHTQTIIKR